MPRIADSIAPCVYVKCFHPILTIRRSCPVLLRQILFIFFFTPLLPSVYSACELPCLRSPSIPFFFFFSFLFFLLFFFFFCFFLIFFFFFLLFFFFFFLFCFVKGLSDPPPSPQQHLVLFRRRPLFRARLCLWRFA